MSMGYLIKIQRPPFWQARFPDKSGAEVQRSTKTRDRRQAKAILASWALQAYLDQLGPAGSVAAPVEDVSRPMLAGYRDFCLARGQAPGTIRQRLEVLHLLWEEAIRDGLVKHNPVTGVLVKEPKPRVKEQAKKRVALTMAEGIKLVDAATVDELVAVVVGLDTGARIGDAFGLEAARVDLHEGKIEFWVEKSDRWPTVYLFLPTVEFLREFLVHYHPARLDRDLMRGDSRFLMPSLGVPSGPEVDAAEHKSALTAADDVIGALVERAGIGEWVTRPSGSRFHTVRYPVFRITSNNALKMGGVTTEWVMARMCQKSKKANEAYDRADEHNVRKAVFGQLGILQKGEQCQAGTRTEVKDGSMTFTEMMELVHYATRRLVALQHEHLSEPPPQRMAPDWSI
jgi:integrase